VKLWLYYIGKPRDPYANRISEDFVARTSRYTSIEMREVRADRFDPWEKHPSARKILLDPAGKEMNSADFSALISRAGMEGQDLVFVVGGHDGLPSGWAARADLLLSLSRMTWPHELARAMLAEQIYRAYTTLRGHPYPR
jgi:23S rRNA (pseudouridine1915-N3)-methyltransferase